MLFKSSRKQKTENKYNEILEKLETLSIGSPEWTATVDGLAKINEQLDNSSKNNKELGIKLLSTVSLFGLGYLGYIVSVEDRLPAEGFRRLIDNVLGRVSKN